MKIYTLLENTTCRENLAAEHGLSLYIETGSHNILFDTGQTGAFADNAEKMGVDLKNVDMVILSHGHYDHGGGLKRFLEINQTAPVYLSRHAFRACYSSGKYIGLDSGLQTSSRLIPVDDHLDVDTGISLFSCNGLERPYIAGTFGQTVLEEGIHFPDDYRHEQYLLVEEAGKKYLFSGCSHKGMLNILHWFHPDVFFGGFHFIRIDPASPELENAAKFLAACKTRYFTGHCTGMEQFRAMQKILGSRLQYIAAGSEISL